LAYGVFGVWRIVWRIMVPVLKPRDVRVMVLLKWTVCKPAVPGWYWYRGPAGEADPLIVQVDEAGQFQWPDGAFQEVSLTKGEWAGPIEPPAEG
jgi:hypothetical protein